MMNKISRTNLLNYHPLIGNLSMNSLDIVKATTEKTQTTYIKIINKFVNNCTHRTLLFHFFERRYFLCQEIQCYSIIDPSSLSH